ncbi:MAG: hypothetical protein ACYC96_17030, partial [Fimbriimonadaceae bacterium]
SNGGVRFHGHRCPLWRPLVSALRATAVRFRGHPCPLSRRFCNAIDMRANWQLQQQKEANDKAARAQARNRRGYYGGF